MHSSFFLVFLYIINYNNVHYYIIVLSAATLMVSNRANKKKYI